MRRTLAFGITLVALAACTDLTTLTQSNPGALSTATVYTPLNAPLIVNGAISDFECAFSRYVVGSGVFTDELANGISNGANFDYDRRTLQTGASYGTGTCGSNQQAPIYTPLSIARRSADTAIAYLKGWTDAQMPAGVNRPKLIGQSYAYAGYSLVLMGEGMCSAAINLGPELTPAQMFAEAKSRFDSAIVAATSASDAATVGFATLGRARTQLDLGNVAAAGTDAALIQPGFVTNMSTDAINIRRENFVFFTINNSNFATVDASFRGLTVNGAPDPRVAVTNTGATGSAGPSSQIWTVDKYPSLSTVMPIARYAEAQLIVAEAKAAAGVLAGSVLAINAARATHAGLPAYDGTGQGAAQLKTQIIEERRRELFLEGHRLGDLRRYNLAFTPASGTPYPNGATYGTQTCFPLPDVERINNPNISKTP